MYSREIDGRVLTLTTSGWTYYSQHMLFDHETEGFWFQLPGTSDLTCVAGPMAGRVLKGRPFHRGPWHAWRAIHPASWYMAPRR